jgi:hypothetical protein
MEDTWQCQLRLAVSAELADVLRKDPGCSAHAALGEVLRRHDASLKCQFDAFADYVSEAEKLGTENYPLYQWTKDTIGKPEKKARYLRSFSVYVDGNEVYDKTVADAMENELVALVSDDGIHSVEKYDTNPANNPQPPSRER